ncbi:MAG: ABC transporter ATP-binding protein [Tissierellaceae bacterium]|nr:ABC transporter ATP-binding protein [Tissierellaceae bacterium]
MKHIKKLKMFFTLAWRISPSYIILLIADTLLTSLQIFSNVILPKFLIDELVGDMNINRLILFGSLIVLSNVFFTFLTNTTKKYMDVKKIYMSEKFSQEMARKIMNVEFFYLENPYYLDLKERAVFAINNQGALQSLIVQIAMTLKNIITIAGLLTIMFTLSWVLVLLLVITIIISVLIYKSFVSYQMDFFQEIIPVNRKYGYYVGFAYDDKIQKDIRLYDMNKMMTDRVAYYNDEINTWFSAYYKKQGKYLGSIGVVNDLQSALAYGYVGLRVISSRFGQRISIGSFTMYVSAAINFTTTTMELGRSLIGLVQMLGYLEPFMEFMSLPDEDTLDGKHEFIGEIESIEFKDVSFKYPGSETFVLEDISFNIDKGEKISIVGLNGAGKTTMIKLICRLYHPTKGTILINGRNIFDYDHKSYMDKIAAVFQDYKLFAFSIDENITCKEINSDSEKTMDIIEEVGLKDKIDELLDGIASLYGKAYDEKGIEMSGGESQKIAIARALYKDASLIILDEPTSALDPLAEAEIYEHFNSMVGDKTAIYISHRMSSSVFCDKILVIDQGRISDYDTHKNLLKDEDSLYTKLFKSQAVNYELS